MKDFKVYQASGYLTKLVTDASDVRKEYGEISGSLVQFDTPISAPLESLIVDINPVQSGSGEPSPTNIRPITGWTGCEVTRLGANILPYPYFDSSVTKSGITFTVNDDYTVTVNGTASNDAIFELCRTYPYSNDELVLDKMITLTGCPQNGSQSTYYLSAVITGHKDIGSGVSFKMTNAGYFRFSIVIKSGVTVNNLIFKPMIIVGDIVQAYEPYSGTTLSVTFPDSTGTVYGGTVDLVSGVLTINEVKLTLNGNSSDGNYSRISSGRFNIDNLPINYFRNESAANSGESSQHKSLPQTPTNGQFDTLAANYSAAFDVSLNLSGNTLRIKDTRFDTVAELQAAYATEKPQFVLTLATPITYQLTPQEINTLIGVNNIWADTGDVSVKYRTH